MYRKRIHPDISDTFSSSDVTQTFCLLKHMKLTVMMKFKEMCVWKNMNTHMRVSCVCLITSIRPIRDLWLNSLQLLRLSSNTQGNVCPDKQDITFYKSQKSTVYVVLN